MATEDENRPLLLLDPSSNSLEQAQEEPPPYRSFEDKGHELEPPPYTWSQEGPPTPTLSEGSSGGSSLIPHISCRVCQTMLSVEGKLHLHVIKCYSCNEATPIRPAPPGKKYVRCPCNCLLICKLTSHRIICPRSNCKRVITLEPIQNTATYAYNPRDPTQRITCAYCNSQFLWVRLNDTCERCPHCDRLSSFGPGFRKKRMKTYFVLAILFLCIAITINITTLEDIYDRESPRPKSILIGFPIMWGVLYLISLVMLLFFMKYRCLAISTIERPQLQYGT